jgi:hypothetical protein
MSIRKVSRNGIVTLSFFAQKGSIDLIGEIYNSSLSFELISKETSDIDFYISEIKAPQGIIEVKLLFADASKISSSVVRLFFISDFIGT